MNLCVETHKCVCVCISAQPGVRFVVSVSLCCGLRGWSMLLYCFPRIQSSSTGGEGDSSAGKEKVEERGRDRVRELEMETESMLERATNTLRMRGRREMRYTDSAQGEVKRYITVIKRWRGAENWGSGRATQVWPKLFSHALHTEDCCMFPISAMLHESWVRVEGVERTPVLTWCHPSNRPYPLPARRDCCPSGPLLVCASALLQVLMQTWPVSETTSLDGRAEYSLLTLSSWVWIGIELDKPHRKLNCNNRKQNWLNVN